MFGLGKKDPLAKLEKQYRDKLEEARDAQRAGKIPRFAELSAEAEALAERIDALKADG